MKKILYFLVPLILFSCKKIEKSTDSEKVELIKTEFKAEIEKDEPKTKYSKPEINLKCNFETYIEYKDSLPLFVKPNGKTAKYFRFEDDPEYDFGGGFLFKNSELGWLQIGKDEFYPDMKNLIRIPK